MRESRIDLPYRALAALCWVFAVAGLLPAVASAKILPIDTMPSTTDVVVSAPPTKVVVRAIASSKSARVTKRAGLYPDAAVVGRQIRAYRKSTWAWQKIMGAHTTPVANTPLPPSLPYRLWVRDLWKERANKARLLAQNPPHRQQWLCIHRYEGSWSDAGAPYYGGLQMDLTFQRHYGGALLVTKGTAEHWTPLEQMWVAEHAYRSGRGFFPWPNTARTCGLL